MAFSAVAIPLSYEQQLSGDLAWALREGSLYFENGGAVQEALRRITNRLDSLNIDYVLVGGIALFFHGLRRFTEDVDILVSPEGLQQAHEALEGSGYRPLFPESRNLRDAESGVRIEFLITGEYPGDGKVKPVAFPDPKLVATEVDGIKLLQLPSLIELKLASGMTGAGRLKDLADVQELIKLLDLPQDYAKQISPYVQDRYNELWQSVKK